MHHRVDPSGVEIIADACRDLPGKRQLGIGRELAGQRPRRFFAGDLFAQRHQARPQAFEQRQQFSRFCTRLEFVEQAVVKVFARRGQARCRLAFQRDIALQRRREHGKVLLGARLRPDALAL